MSRRDEVEKLEDQIYGGLSPEIGYDFSGAKEALEKLMAMALESVPTQYVDVKDVKTGHYMAMWGYSGRREPISVDLCDGDLLASVTGHTQKFQLDTFTDFLPVPSWLVEGIKSEGEKTND